LKCRQYDVKVFEIKIENDKSFIDFMENNYVLLKNHLLSIKGHISETISKYLADKNIKYVNNMELPIKRGIKDACIISRIEAQNRALFEEAGEAIRIKKEMERERALQNLNLDMERDLAVENFPKTEPKTQNILQPNPETTSHSQSDLEITQKSNLEELQKSLEKENRESSFKKEKRIKIKELKKISITEKDILEKSPTIEDFGYGTSPLKVIVKPLRSGQFIQHDGAVLVMDRLNSGAKVVALGSVIALGVVEGDISSTGECLIIPRVKKGNIFFHGYRIELERLIYPLNKLVFIGDRIIVQAISKKELI